MKNYLKTLVFILPLFLSVNSFSQGDLQFNRVRFETIIFPSNTGGTQLDTLVVPQGKVLKITSISGLRNTRVTGAIGDHEVGPYGDAFPAIFPIWLPSGAHIVRTTYNYQYSGTNPIVIKFSFSGIEFNVVP